MKLRNQLLAAFESFEGSETPEGDAIDSLRDENDSLAAQAEEIEQLEGTVSALEALVHVIEQQGNQLSTASLEAFDVCITSLLAPYKLPASGRFVSMEDGSTKLDALKSFIDSVRKLLKERVAEFTSQLTRFKHRFFPSIATLRTESQRLLARLDKLPDDIALSEGAVIQGIDLNPLLMGQDTLEDPMQILALHTDAVMVFHDVFGKGFTKTYKGALESILGVDSLDEKAIQKAATAFLKRYPSYQRLFVDRGLVDAMEMLGYTFIPAPETYVKMIDLHRKRVQGIYRDLAQFALECKCTFEFPENPYLKLVKDIPAMGLTEIRSVAEETIKLCEIILAEKDVGDAKDYSHELDKLQMSIQAAKADEVKTSQLSIVAEVANSLSRLPEVAYYRTLQIYLRVLDTGEQLRLWANESLKLHR